MAANPLPTPALTLNTERKETESIIHCAGRINTETAAVLRQTARTLIAEDKRVTLDFSQVTHVDSSGLGMIVGLLISAKKSRCELKFVNLTPRVKDLFTLTRLIDALEGREEYLGLTPD